jgi:hypothetical protein
VEGIDLSAVPGHEGRMLFHAMGVKAVNPENRVIDAIADAGVLGKLHDPAQAECAQSRIVKGGGTDNVRDTDAGMVDHYDQSLLTKIDNATAQS